ncbi:uncharacterized protein LOC106467233, partial [Limulus polyphemus]|uniref:Uncharacterized protein LOC106467233 n=1 Tax=Limulus polyphemus TaxID=6850 RepID=A0ABM1T5C1_LIMPO
VAIKTIKKSKIESEKDLIRIRREIQIMSSIQHPHIIHIYEVFENKEKIVLVMQYASGGELYDLLSERKVFIETDARRLFRQITAAVYYCHKNKICHRDLKLENILLDEKGNAKIGDFGLSNVFNDRRLLSTFCGSPLYASPEIVKGVPYHGPEVDCWSLGVLLYTLVYGAMPFDGGNFKRLVRQICEGDYHEPKIKSEASGLIRRLLTVSPAKRATIVDICMDWWVNLGYNNSLLQVSEDLSNLTPVRLELLLALMPSSSMTLNPFQKEDFSVVPVRTAKYVVSDNHTSSSLTAVSENGIPEELFEGEDGDTTTDSFDFVEGEAAEYLITSAAKYQKLHDSNNAEENSLSFGTLNTNIGGSKCVTQEPVEKNMDKSLSVSYESQNIRKSNLLLHTFNQDNKSYSTYTDLEDESIKTSPNMVTTDNQGDQKSGYTFEIEEALHDRKPVITDHSKEGEMKIEEKEYDNREPQLTIPNTSQSALEIRLLSQDMFEDSGKNSYTSPENSEGNEKKDLKTPMNNEDNECDSLYKEHVTKTPVMPQQQKDIYEHTRENETNHKLSDEKQSTEKLGGYLLGNENEYKNEPQSKTSSNQKEDVSVTSDGEVTVMNKQSNNPLIEEVLSQDCGAPTSSNTPTIIAEQQSDSNSVTVLQKDRIVIQPQKDGSLNACQSPEESASCKTVLEIGISSSSSSVPTDSVHIITTPAKPDESVSLSEERKDSSTERTEISSNKPISENSVPIKNTFKMNSSTSKTVPKRDISPSKTNLQTNNLPIKSTLKTGKSANNHKEKASSEQITAHSVLSQAISQERNSFGQIMPNEAKSLDQDTEQDHRLSDQNFKNKDTEFDPSCKQNKSLIQTDDLLNNKSHDKTTKEYNVSLYQDKVHENISFDRSTSHEGKMSDMEIAEADSSLIQTSTNTNDSTEKAKPSNKNVQNKKKCPSKLPVVQKAETSFQKTTTKSKTCVEIGQPNLTQTNKPGVRKPGKIAIPTFFESPKPCSSPQGTEVRKIFSLKSVSDARKAFENKVNSPAKETDTHKISEKTKDSKTAPSSENFTKSSNTPVTTSPTSPSSTPRITGSIDDSSKRKSPSPIKSPPVIESSMSSNLIQSSPIKPGKGQSPPTSKAIKGSPTSQETPSSCKVSKPSSSVPTSISRRGSSSRRSRSPEKKNSSQAQSSSPEGKNCKQHTNKNTLSLNHSLTTCKDEQTKIVLKNKILKEESVKQEIISEILAEEKQHGDTLNINTALTTQDTSSEKEKTKGNKTTHERQEREQFLSTKSPAVTGIEVIKQKEMSRKTENPAISDKNTQERQSLSTESFITDDVQMIKQKEPPRKAENLPKTGKNTQEPLSTESFITNDVQMIKQKEPPRKAENLPKTGKNMQEPLSIESSITDDVQMIKQNEPPRKAENLPKTGKNTQEPLSIESFITDDVQMIKQNEPPRKAENLPKTGKNTQEPLSIESFITDDVQMIKQDKPSRKAENLPKTGKNTQEPLSTESFITDDEPLSAENFSTDDIQMIKQKQPSRKAEKLTKADQNTQERQEHGEPLSAESSTTIKQIEPPIKAADLIKGGRNTQEKQEHEQPLSTESSSTDGVQIIKQKEISRMAENLTKADQNTQEGQEHEQSLSPENSDTDDIQLIKQKEPSGKFEAVTKTSQNTHERQEHVQSSSTESSVIDDIQTIKEKDPSRKIEGVRKINKNIQESQECDQPLSTESPIIDDIQVIEQKEPHRKVKSETRDQPINILSDLSINLSVQTPTEFNTNEQPTADNPLIKDPFKEDLTDIKETFTSKNVDSVSDSNLSVPYEYTNTVSTPRASKISQEETALSSKNKTKVSLKPISYSTPVTPQMLHKVYDTDLNCVGSKQEVLRNICTASNEQINNLNTKEFSIGRRQTSSSSESDMNIETENNRADLRRLSPEGASEKQYYGNSNVRINSGSDKNESNVPPQITRSYRKFTFNSDGSCVTETGKIYATPAGGGTWTKVERKTKITNKPDQNDDDFEKVQHIQYKDVTSDVHRSDSRSSSGSNDILDGPFFRNAYETSWNRKEDNFAHINKNRKQRAKEWLQGETLGGQSTDKESSDNEDYFDIHFEDTDTVTCESQGLWRFLQTVNQDLIARLQSFRNRTLASSSRPIRQHSLRMPSNQQNKGKLLSVTRSVSQERPEKVTSRNKDQPDDLCHMGNNTGLESYLTCPRLQTHYHVDSTRTERLHRDHPAKHGMHRKDGGGKSSINNNSKSYSMHSSDINKIPEDDNGKRESTYGFVRPKASQIARNNSVMDTLQCEGATSIINDSNVQTSVQTHNSQVAYPRELSENRRQNVEEWLLKSELGQEGANISDSSRRDKCKISFSKDRCQSDPAFLQTGQHKTEYNYHGNQMGMDSTRKPSMLDATEDQLPLKTPADKGILANDQSSSFSHSYKNYEQFLNSKSSILESTSEPHHGPSPSSEKNTTQEKMQHIPCPQSLFVNVNKDDDLSYNEGCHKKRMFPVSSQGRPVFRINLPFSKSNLNMQSVTSEFHRQPEPLNKRWSEESVATSTPPKSSLLDALMNRGYRHVMSQRLCSMGPTSSLAINEENLVDSNKTTKETLGAELDKESQFQSNEPMQDHCPGKENNDSEKEIKYEEKCGEGEMKQNSFSSIQKDKNESSDTNNIPHTDNDKDQRMSENYVDECRRKPKSSIPVKTKVKGKADMSEDSSTLENVDKALTNEDYQVQQKGKEGNQFPREEESVSERILRKSFYSRFNDDRQSRRRRSSYRDNEILQDLKNAGLSGSMCSLSYTDETSDTDSIWVPSSRRGSLRNIPMEDNFSREHSRERARRLSTRLEDYADLPDTQNPSRRTQKKDYLSQHQWAMTLQLSDNIDSDVFNDEKKDSISYSASRKSENVRKNKSDRGRFSLYEPSVSCAPGSGNVSFFERQRALLGNRPSSSRGSYLHSTMSSSYQNLLHDANYLDYDEIPRRRPSLANSTFSLVEEMEDFED